MTWLEYLNAWLKAHENEPMHGTSVSDMIACAREDYERYRTAATNQERP